MRNACGPSTRAKVVDGPSVDPVVLTAHEKPPSRPAIKAETAAIPGDGVEDELPVIPVPCTAPKDKDRRVLNDAQQDITVAGAHLAHRQAHCVGAVCIAALMVKADRAVLRLDFFKQFQCGLSGGDLAVIRQGGIGGFDI